MKKKKKIVLLIILIVIAAIVIGIVVKLKSTSQVVPEGTIGTSIMTVEKQDLSDKISLSGSVDSADKTSVSSKAASEILTVDVQVGDYVKKGDVICTLDKKSIQEQITALNKQISDAAALSKNQSDQNREALKDAKKSRTQQLESAQDAVDDAKSSYNSAKKAYESAKKKATASGLTADEKKALKATADELKTTMEAAKAALKEAENGYDSTKDQADAAVDAAQNTVNMEKYSESSDKESQTQLSTLKEQLNDCTVKASVGGIVTSVNAEKGMVNTPDAALAVIENTEKLILNASVSEKDILKLQEGMKAIVTSDATGDTEYSGEITRVVRATSSGSTGTTGMDGEGASSGSSFSVKITINKSDLLIGMTADAKVIITDKSGVLCVPYDLVRTDDDGSTFVLKAIDNGDGTFTSEKCVITVGEEIDYYTEVTGGDLKEGDQIVYDAAMEPGTKFTPASMDPAINDGTSSEEAIPDKARSTTETEATTVDTMEYTGE